MRVPPLSQAQKYLIFAVIFVALFHSAVFSQRSDNIIRAVKIGTNFNVYVDGLPDSVSRHTIIDQIQLNTDEAGWYRIYFKLAYSGDLQPNEHVFATVVNNDSIITPLDKNLGRIRVLRDTSAVPDTVWRNTGLFFLLEGKNVIWMHHYNAVFKEVSSRNLVANLPDSVLKSIVVGDSIGEKQSVHIDSLIIAGHPYFQAETDVIKKDTFIDSDSDRKISVGDIIEYNIEIFNSGAGIAHDVIYTDTIPAFTSYISGTASTSKGLITSTSPVLQVEVGNILPKLQEKILITYRVRVTSPTDSVRNQGFLESEETSPTPTDDPDTFEKDDPTITKVPDFSGLNDLLKQDFFIDTNGDGQIDPGDSIRYTITIKNSGLGTAHNVVFTDTIPNFTQYVLGSAVTSKGTIVSTSPVLQVEIGSIAPNESEIITISFTVLVTESITMVANQGFLDSDEINPTPTDDPDTDREDDGTKTVIPSFDGKTDLVKEDLFVDANNDGKINAGDSIHYTITIKNSGLGTAHNVVFADTIPNFTQFVPGSAVTSKGTITATSPVFQVEIGSIAPEESETVTISFTVLVTESVTMIANQGFLDSDETNPTPTDDPDSDEEDDQTKTVVPSFNGKTDLLKEDFFVDTNNDGLIDAGDSIRYTITIKNSGLGTAHNVVFTDTIPNFTQYVPGSAVTSKGTIVSTSPVLHVEIGSVAPNESEIVTISFTVLVTESITMVANQGYLDSDETNPTPTDDPETDNDDDKTKTSNSSFSEKNDVLKTDIFIDADSNGSMSPGDTIKYQITIKNSGGAIASHIVFTDTIPANTSLVENSVTTTAGTVTATSPVLTVEIDTISAFSTEIVTIRFSVILTQAVSEIQNQGFVSADNTPTEPTDDPETEIKNDPTRTIMPNFNGKTDLVKTASISDVDDNKLLSPGDIITYSIKIKNSGKGVAHNVVFQDTIPQYTTYVDGSAQTSKGTIQSTSPVLIVNVGKIAPDNQETVTISFQVKLTETVEQVSNQGFVKSDEVGPIPTDDENTEEEDDPTIIDNTKFFTDIELLQFVHTDSFFIQDGDTINFANEGEKYQVTISLTNISTKDAGEISLKAWFTDSLTISEIQPVGFTQQNDTLIWNFSGLPADSSLKIQYWAKVPLIMAVGQNPLIHGARVTCVNEDPTRLANNTVIDTVYSFGREIPIPEIQATPSILDVTDSVTISVKIPADKVSWDLWIYLPDGQTVKDFADEFISTTNIERDTWVEIPVKYSQSHLLTKEKQEQVIFEVRTTEIRGIERTAQTGVTFVSSNYLVLDRNVFRPDIDGRLGIKFKLSYGRLAQLDVYDLAGTHITRIAEDVFLGGWNTYYWDGSTETGQKVGSGVYLITLRTDEFKAWKKVIIIR